MATYASISTQAEDAFATAFATIAGSDLDSGWTVYKGGAPAEMVTPCIVIAATSADAIEGPAKVKSTFMVTIESHAITNAEDTSQTRTVHGNLAGLVQAVLFRSAEQIKTECEAAGTSDFTAQLWTPTTIRNEYEDQRRRSIFAGVLICASTD